MNQESVRRSGKPNVVVFFTDQQRWDCSGLHGNPLELMPNFDRLAQQGTFLAKSFTCQPVCGPARACLQTGTYATTNGVFHNAMTLPSESKTLAHYFKDAGYTTGYIGKWHLADTAVKGPVSVEQRGGYEYWLGANAVEWTSEPYNCVLYDNDNKAVTLPGYRVDAETDAAIRYIDVHREEPFFLFLSFLEPHHQNHVDDYPPPDGYRERYTGRWIPTDLEALKGSSAQHLGGYYGMVKRLDEALGRMMDALKSRGLEENTIVLFTTDHGCHFKTRNSEYKRSGHESSIRIPTALWGGPFNGRGRVDELTSLVDLTPTLLDAVGIDVPGHMQGRSIMPLLRGDKAGWPEEVFVQVSENYTGRAIRTQKWKYAVRVEARVAASERYTEEFLYDLESDPYELANLIQMESHRGVAKMLRERLIKKMVEIGEKAPVIEEAPVVNSGQRRVDAGEERM